MNFIGAFVWGWVGIAGIVIGIGCDSGFAAVLGICALARALQHGTGHT